MSFSAFLAEAVVISLSGVMAPGPITSVVIGKGSKSPHAGAIVSLGHAVVEFPVMIAVFYGVGRLLEIPYARAVIAVVGGLVLLWMGYGMLRSLRRDVALDDQTRHSPFAAGILLSAGNPYFLVWWATVGAALISRSTQFGWGGFLAFGLAHWMCDFVWNYGLSALSFQGGRVLGARFQRGVFLLCGTALIFFGGRFVWQGVTTFLPW
jgi:threonine/homoserine/homoserine lactone efflux protein